MIIAGWGVRGTAKGTFPKVKIGQIESLHLPNRKLGGGRLYFSSLFLGFNVHTIFIKSILTASHLGKHANVSRRDNRSAAETYGRERPHEDTMPDQYPGKLQVIKINDYHEIGLKVCNTCRNLKACLNYRGKILLFQKNSSNGRNMRGKIHRKKINKCL